jgi:hypothetical protein
MRSDSLSSSSGLFYHGTDIDVRLGDRVEVKRLFRRPLEGFVCYIPGISPTNVELEFEDVKQWAIRSADGSVYPILYDPERFQPPRHIRFLERSTHAGIGPTDVLK